mgnify:CR=1 FL=1
MPTVVDTLPRRGFSGVPPHDLITQDFGGFWGATDHGAKDVGACRCQHNPLSFIADREGGADRALRHWQGLGWAVSHG